MSSSSILQSYSQISTNVRCNNCGVNIMRVNWEQCMICKRFNLCDQCNQYPHDRLEVLVQKNHRQMHRELGNTDSITSECMQLVSLITLSQDRQTLNEQFNCIMKKKKIYNDIDISIVMSKLKQMKTRSLTLNEEQHKQQLHSMIVDYHMRTFDSTLRVLSLDGGGVRGYMPIKVLQELISEKYLPNIKEFDSKTEKHREQFRHAQSRFTDQFDYFAGTSTGGLIAFCLAVGYNILDMGEIYSCASYYFKRNFFGPIFCAKYNPSRIHAKIDEIIGTITLKNGKRLTAENATLLDIHNYLNPNAFVSDDLLESSFVQHGNLLEFIDDDDIPLMMNEDHQFRRVKREKVLLITSYNATKDEITVFNTSYAKHWSYRIADVLKATMAAPTYFPPQPISRGIVENGQFKPNQFPPEIFVDGGIFANDPELVALWAIRMQWKKLINYHILSIGTGTYNTPIKSLNLGGYLGWLGNNGLIINTLMEATCSLTEVISSNLAKLNNMKRMKFNYKLTESMSLDDAAFVNKFDQEWKDLKTKADYQTLKYFYNKYIHHK